MVYLTSEVRGKRERDIEWVSIAISFTMVSINKCINGTIYYRLKRQEGELRERGREEGVEQHDREKVRGGVEREREREREREIQYAH